MNKLDLIHAIHTPEFFQDHTYGVSIFSDKTLYVFDKVMNESSYNSGNWISNTWNILIKKPVLQTVGRLIDDLAEKELNQIDKSIDKLTSVDRSDIDINKTYLKNLLSNLKNHDKVIKKYNDIHTILTVPQHQQIIEKIEKKLAYLDSLDQNLKLKKFSRVLQFLQDAIDDKDTYSIKALNRGFSDYIDLIKTFDQQDQEEAKQRFQSLLNTHLINSLLWNPKELNHLLEPVKEAMKTTKLEKELPKIDKIRAEVVSKLKTRLNNPKNLNTLPLPELLEKIQSDVINSTLNILSSTKTQKVKLSELLKNYYAYEKSEIDTFDQIKKECIEKKKESIVDSLTYTEEQKQWALEELTDINFSSVDPLKKVFFTTSKKNHITLNKVQSQLHILQKDLGKNTETVKSETMKIIDKKLDEIQKNYWGWFQDHQKARQFPFSQGWWGSNEMLGRGICKAINYRWIKKIMAHPTDDIKNVAQLEDPVNIPLKEGGSRLSARDRMNQATSSLEWHSGQTTDSIGQTVSKRDKLTGETLFKGDSVRKMIDSLCEQDLKKPIFERSGGVFDITATGKDSAHALGIQIDPKHNIYRFWDVNTGLYQFNSREQLTDAFESYMAKYYENKFTKFTAFQYLSTIQTTENKTRSE